MLETLVLLVGVVKNCLEGNQNIFFLENLMEGWIEEALATKLLKILAILTTFFALPIPRIRKIGSSIRSYKSWERW